MSNSEEKNQIKMLQKQVVELQKQTAVSDSRQEQQLKMIEKEITEMKALVLSVYATKQEVKSMVDSASNQLSVEIQKNEVINSQSRKIVFGMVGTILLAVVTAVVALVVK